MPLRRHDLLTRKTFDLGLVGSETHYAEADALIYRLRDENDSLLLRTEGLRRTCSPGSRCPSRCAGTTLGEREQPRKIGCIGGDER